MKRYNIASQWSKEEYYAKEGGVVASTSAIILDGVTNTVQNDVTTTTTSFFPKANVLDLQNRRIVRGVRPTTTSFIDLPTPATVTTSNTTSSLSSSNQPSKIRRLSRSKAHRMSVCQPEEQMSQHHPQGFTNRSSKKRSYHVNALPTTFPTMAETTPTAATTHMNQRVTERMKEHQIKHHNIMKATISNILMNIVASTESEQVDQQLERLSTICRPPSMENDDDSHESNVKNHIQNKKDCKNIENFWNYKTCCQYVYHLRGHIILMGTMQRFGTHAIIQMKLCVLISHVGMNHKEFCQAMIELGAIDRVLQVMTDFPDLTTKMLLQYATSYCLIVLCQYWDANNMMMLQENQQQQQQQPTRNTMEAIVSTILHFMKMTCQDVVVSRMACSALHNLCSLHHDFIVLIMEKNGLGILSNAITLFPHDTILQHNARHVMKLLL
jgi:hypothetical protein